MITSTTAHKNTKKPKKFLAASAAAIFWLAAWQLVSMLVGEALFVTSPLSVLRTLLMLLGQREFYATVGFSLLRISLGFMTAAIAGTGLALAAYKLGFLRVLFRPLIGAVKAAPVASFAVIALLAVGSKNLSALIAFLMVLPVFYTNMLTGLLSVEPERFEAADVFGMVPGDRFRFIYLPYVAPFFTGACQLGIGVAWKAGISAEVIGIAVGSIGEKIYDAKLNLETAELFAYTLVIIALSLFLEKLAELLIRALEKKLTKSSMPRQT